MRCLRGLFFGGRENAFSLGRVAFCVVLGLACWRWASGLDIPAGHKEILGFLLAYLLGGKAVARWGGGGRTSAGPDDKGRG